MGIIPYFTRFLQTEKLKARETRFTVQPDLVTSVSSRSPGLFLLFWQPG